jgi:hypothetical protein
MFTEIPLSALTKEALFVIRNSIMTGNRFSHFGPNGNACLEKAIADIDAELDRRSSQRAA